jgi:outer membrane protein assembly factor BamE (lipoprotein component of BamABCDE complex)
MRGRDERARVLSPFTAGRTHRPEHLPQQGRKVIDRPCQSRCACSRPSLLYYAVASCFFIVANMKHLTFSVVAFFLLAADGCALSYHRTTYNDGYDFPSENVNQIIRGKTTSDELVQMFGGPLAKTEVSEDEEIWRYSSTTGIKTEQTGFLTDEVQSTRQRKTLDIRLKNGTVTDFNYTEGN